MPTDSPDVVKSALQDAAAPSESSNLIPQSLEDAMKAALKQADTVRVAPPLPTSRFEFREEIGRGGTALVYAAFDKKLGREVAVKVLREESRSDCETAIRFRREAETAAKLSHPNIVTMFDTGWEAGRMILVMELVRGKTMADEIESGLTIRRGVEILETVSRAADYAHQSGVIHRDLKPGNILLGENGVPKISDFGLARRLDSETALTATGTAMGTPWYMAPEQAAGKSNLLSPRTDVYALGAILYHVLAGRAPHIGDTAADVIRRVAFEDPVPPSRLNPAIPADLEVVALRALEKDPARRYPSAAALADDLRRHLDGGKVAARRPGPVRRMDKWIRRHVALAAAGAVLIVALAGIASWFVAQYVRKVARVNALASAMLAEQAPEKAADLCAEIKAIDPAYPGIDTLLAERRSKASRQKAETLTEIGAAAAARALEIEKALEHLRAEHDTLFKSLDYRKDAGKHAELWRKETDIADLERELTKQRTLALALHSQAVEIDQTYTKPRRFLADYYWSVFLSAEWEEDPIRMAEARAQLSMHDKERFRECDEARGSAALSSVPAGASIEIFRYEEADDRRLVPRPVADAPANLPSGSYLAVFRLDGRRETRFPFAISRRYPRVEASVRMLTDAEIGAGFVYVPGGRYIVGPDDHRVAVVTPDLVAQRCELTRGEYAEWLQDLAKTGGAEALKDHLPHAGWEMHGGIPVPKEPDGALLPAGGMSWESAVAYCKWRSKRDGFSWRLPTVEEREVLARGADARTFPWGRSFDWIWTNGGLSHPDRSILPVDSTPEDVSPFGIRDLAGNIKEWCADWHNRKAHLRAVRGADYGDTEWANFRSYYADGAKEKERDKDVGFRIVRTLDTK